MSANPKPRKPPKALDSDSPNRLVVYATARTSGSGMGAGFADRALTTLGRECLDIVKRFLGRAPDYRGANWVGIYLKYTIRPPEGIPKTGGRWVPTTMGRYGRYVRNKGRHFPQVEGGEESALLVAADRLLDDGINVEVVIDRKPRDRAPAGYVTLYLT